MHYRYEKQNKTIKHLVLEEEEKQSTDFFLNKTLTHDVAVCFYIVGHAKGGHS